MIRFSGVDKVYDPNHRPALKNVDLALSPGEFAFLVGASGSGKSTVMRLILREDRPTAGEIEVAGRSLLDRSLDMAREAGIGRIVVNTHYLGDQIRDHLAGSDVAISDESEALLETGGGLRKALPLGASISLDMFPVGPLKSTKRTAN